MSYLRNIKMLMKDNYESIGFVPISVIERAENNINGHIFHQIDDKEWVGYLYSGVIRPNKYSHIYQECIDKDARRYGSGKRCFKEMEILCKINSSRGIVLRCADELESNLFWLSMGFHLVGVDITDNQRSRAINLYAKNFSGNYDLLNIRNAFRRTKNKNIIWINEKENDNDISVVKLFDSING